MATLLQKTASVTTAFVLGLTLTTTSLTAASADETHSATVSSAAENTEVTPADLPVQSLESVRAEAESRGYAPEAVESAVALQEIVNAYHELPTELQGLPTSDPRVEAALEEIIDKDISTPEPNRNPVRSSSLRSAASGFDPIAATDCILAIADALTIVVPGVNAWKWIKAAGGVISVADAVNEVIQGKSEDALLKVLGKEGAEQFQKVLGVKGVVENCVL